MLLISSGCIPYRQIIKLKLRVDFLEEDLNRKYEEMTRKCALIIFLLKFRKNPTGTRMEKQRFHQNIQFSQKYIYIYIQFKTGFDAVN